MGIHVVEIISPSSSCAFMSFDAEEWMACYDKYSHFNLKKLLGLCFTEDTSFVLQKIIFSSSSVKLICQVYFNWFQHQNAKHNLKVFHLNCRTNWHHSANLSSFCFLHLKHAFCQIIDCFQKRLAMCQSDKLNIESE